MKTTGIGITTVTDKNLFSLTSNVQFRYISNLHQINKKLIKKLPLIILASSSPRRIELLKKLKINFITEKAEIDETPQPKETCCQLVKRLSLEKAKKVAEKYQDKDCLIIGADTAVELNNEILGKPKNKNRAIKMLQKLSNQAHWVLTGITIINPQTKEKITRVEKTKVFFRQLSDKEIIDYVNSGEPFNKAGAYAIQEKGGLFVKKIEGDFFNVVGLPIYKLQRMLKKFY